jgi:hypothetical protein
MANKIKESNITDGAVTSDKIAPGTVNADRLAGSIPGSKIAPATIDTPNIAPAAVTAPTIAPGAITTTQISPSAGIVSSQIAPGTIANDRLANTGITINGTTIALGASGSIVAGTDWQSVVVADGSTGTTASAGEGYFIDTTSATHTITLPADGSSTIGDTIIIRDYAGTFATNNVTLTSTAKISGVDVDGTLSTNDLVVTVVYVDSTKGWVTIENEAKAVGATVPVFVTATGGTVTESGDYKIHTFTGDGCFVVSSVGNPAGSDSVDYLVVAGGGGTPGLSFNNTPSGGGGAGGLRASATTYSIGCNPAGPLVCGVSAVPVTATTYPVTVGGGGAGGSSGPGNSGASGSNSSFSTITSAGGGKGGHPASAAADNGGSGGGGTSNSDAGTGNTPPVTPPQGNPGGVGVANPTNPSPGSDNTGLGGGGGAIQPGFSGGTQTPGGGGGDGGDGAGFTNGAFGASNGECVSCVQYFAGGGAGGVYTPNPTPNPGGIGGLGGGGNGGSPSNPSCVTSPARVGQNGTANTGGGGASSGGAPSPSDNFVGQAGGKGIVVIRYKFQ